MYSFIILFLYIICNLPYFLINYYKQRTSTTIYVGGFSKYFYIAKLRTQYVPSHFQVADVFTKSVSRPLFEFFRFPSFTLVQIRPSTCGVLRIVDHLLRQIYYIHLLFFYFIFIVISILFLICHISFIVRKISSQYQ